MCTCGGLRRFSTQKFLSTFIAFFFFFLPSNENATNQTQDGEGQEVIFQMDNESSK